MKKHTFKQAASQGAKQGAKKAAKQLWKKFNPQWRKKQKGDALVQEPSAGRVSDGASLTYKKCWKRQGQSFIGQDISTWGQAPSYKTVWRVEIQASIDWTELPSSVTSTTVKPAT